MPLSYSSSGTCILWASEGGQRALHFCALYRPHREEWHWSLFSPLLSVLCMGKVRSNNSSLLARKREDTVFNKQLKTCRSTQFTRRGARILADAVPFPLATRAGARGQVQKPKLRRGSPDRGDRWSGHRPR